MKLSRKIFKLYCQTRTDMPTCAILFGVLGHTIEDDKWNWKWICGNLIIQNTHSSIFGYILWLIAFGRIFSFYIFLLKGGITYLRVYGNWNHIFCECYFHFSSQNRIAFKDVDLRVCFPSSLGTDRLPCGQKY